MKDPQPPQTPPPAPPAPPAATTQTAAGETAPPPTDATLTPPEATTDQGSLDDHHAATAAEGEGMPPAPEPPPPPPPPAAQGAPQATQDAQTPVSPEVPAGGDAPITPAVPQDGEAGLHEALPSIPDINEIPEAVKAVCLADGIPEAEYARDFPLPESVRERLILASIKRLTGVRPPMGDPSIAKAAEKCVNVGALLDLMTEGHPDHPVNSGAGS